MSRLAASDRAAIEAVFEQQRQAWNRGDLDAFMAGYARDEALVFTSAGQVRRGWQDTLERYRTRYGGDPAAMGTLAFALESIQAVGADGAVVLGRWRLEATPPGRGVFSVVLERRAEGWRIVHDHTWSDAASDPAAMHAPLAPG